MRGGGGRKENNAHKWVAITVSRTPGHHTEESPHCDYWDGDDVADKENRLGGDGDYSDDYGYDVSDVENDGDDFGMACTHGDMLKVNYSLHYWN